MPTRYSDPLLTCDGCGSTAPRPVTRGIGLESHKAAWRALYASGWRVVANPYEQGVRLLPRTSLVSCPSCPPAAPGDTEGLYRPQAPSVDLPVPTAP